MDRRNFFKIVTGFVAGVLMPKKSVGQKRSGTRPATAEENGEIRKYLREHYIYWGDNPNNIESYFHLIDREYQMISNGTSSNSVNYMISIKYWDKDEPDIYTFEDGVPVS